jgi:hypothetical protein
MVSLLIIMMNWSSLTTSHAFVPPRRFVVQQHQHHHHHHHHHQQQQQPKPQQQYSYPMSVVVSHQFKTLSLLSSLSSSSSSSSFSTALRMGLVEDFISSSDQQTRQRENEQYIQSLQQRVDIINQWEAIMEELEDEQLQAKTIEFQQRLAAGGEDTINGPLLEEAFAVVREAAW